jgi:wyosine [tRNA(Phe)-imidazoG37] synthetase (radical SAM superfamily)
MALELKCADGRGILAQEREIIVRILYGPIESWRFGRSLGVDPLAARHKLCPFSCVYCQYGETSEQTVRRRVYVPAAKLEAELDTLGDVSADCVTFAGLGEPTLAANLPALVAAVRERLTLPVTVLTGGALFPDPGVCRDLEYFDRVVVTLNAPGEALFQQINRPAHSYPYSLAAIVQALRHFRETYAGELVLQAMFVQGNKHAAPEIAALARTLGPDEVQLSTPLQPALGGPLPAKDMQVVAQAFAGLPLRSIYERGQARITPRHM